MSKTFENELYHYGVKGIRRYQNEDGSLTAAGRARYNEREGTIKEKVYGDRRAKRLTNRALLNLKSQLAENAYTVRKNDEAINKYNRKIEKLKNKEQNERRINKINKLASNVKLGKDYNKVLSKRNKQLTGRMNDISSGKAKVGRDFSVSAKATKRGKYYRYGLPIVTGVGSYLASGGRYAAVVAGGGKHYDNQRITWNTNSPYNKHRKKRK